ncbi:AAA family ATPase [Priestia aryabhattai]|uniref:AAA family ATPase n=1 Tax=Priestia aryabhattai TaxID=412384 RepID=UPI003D2AFD2D
MEIVYMWLRSNKTNFEDSDEFGMKNQGCNFGGRFRFNYDFEKKVIEIKENPIWQDDFFVLPSEDQHFNSLARITNVTAVVGENGTGKTSLLNYMKRNLVYGRELERPEAIFIFFDHIKGKYYIYHHANILIKDIIRSANCNIDISEPLQTYQNSKINGKFPKGIPLLKDNTFIFFSNAFDSKDWEEQKKNLRNISTNYLFRESTNSIGLQEITMHRFQEVKRQIEFIRFFPDYAGKYFSSFDNLLNRLPKELIIHFHSHDFNSDLKHSDFIIEFMENFERDLSINYDEKDLYFMNYLTKILVRHFITELVYYIAKPHFNDNLRTQIISIVFEDYYNSNEKDPYKKFEEWLENIAFGAHLAINNVIKNLAHAVLRFKKSLAVIIKEEQVEIKGRVIKLNISNAMHIIDELMWPYNHSTIQNEFMTMDWRNLSSGEKALLNLYSRFFYLAKLDSDNRKKANSPHQLCNNLTILVDEGELYFHPQWQKELIYNLLNFLPYAFRSEQIRRIQIIITSNSPFILSDLPSTNVIFLQRKRNESQVLDGLEEQPQTFAANIHSLLSNSFFIKDGLISSFAKEKVNKVIDLLINESSQVIKENNDIITKTIDMIGEPVIKNKLMNMYQDKLALDYIHMESRLEERIAELQEQMDTLVKLNKLKKGN